LCTVPQASFADCPFGKAKMKRKAAFCLFACAISFSVAGARAQSSGSTQGQTLPEIDLYWNLHPAYRLEMVTSRTNDTTDYNSISIGPTLYYSLRPESGLEERTAEKLMGNQIVFGAGYRAVLNTDKPDENRVELDVTPSYLLPGRVLVDDRNRIDLRSLSTGFSWRYRNRASITRPFKMHRLKLAPYSEVEAYYDIESGFWDKITYTFGVTIDLPKNTDVQTYYERQHNIHTSPGDVNAFGITLQKYFRKSAAIRRAPKTLQ
jgi:Protein of unknown function (DUF2490)